MANHVFAVWDFMTLLKSLQGRLTCVNVPWIPPEDPGSARIINEIVLCEESDEIGRGEYLDHFRLYLTAMREVDADVRPIEQFLDDLRAKVPLETALANARIAPATRRFVLTTFEAARSSTHELAAVFLFGRENLIPSMFTRILQVLDTSDIRSSAFRTYLRRHVEVDGESHGPGSQRLLDRVCGDAAERRHQAMTAALNALQNRRALWDGVIAAFGDDP